MAVDAGSPPVGLDKRYFWVSWDGPVDYVVVKDSLNRCSKKVFSGEYNTILGPYPAGTSFSILVEFWSTSTTPNMKTGTGSIAVLSDASPGSFPPSMNGPHSPTSSPTSNKSGPSIKLPSPLSMYHGDPNDPNNPHFQDSPDHPHEPDDPNYPFNPDDPTGPNYPQPYFYPNFFHPVVDPDSTTDPLPWPPPHVSKDLEQFYDTGNREPWLIKEGVSGYPAMIYCKGTIPDPLPMYDDTGSIDMTGVSEYREIHLDVFRPGQPFFLRLRQRNNINFLGGNL